MRDKWKASAALLVCLAGAAALASIASAAASITITSLQARAGSTSITSGPIGSGYDIRIDATVSQTTWRATRWTTGGVSHCVDHSDQSAGNRSVTLAYQYESNPALREGVLPDPDKVGPSEHVFPPPPGDTSQLTVELFDNNTCAGTALATGQITLTATVPGPNKPLLAACQGMKVAVVLDESGSIASSGATQHVRDATKALAQGLVDTGAKMSVFKFSTTSSASFIAPYQTVNQSFINGQLTTYLNNYNPANATNWESGLAQARNQTLSDPPDLVVFLTDGNPNRVGNGSTSYEEGYYTPMAAAVTVADQLKQTSHVFVIGVGNGVTDPLSALRIEAISGSKTFPEYPISVADYTLVTDFTELEQALRNIASNLCNVTVTVRKETDDQTRDSWASKPGWGFSGRVTLQPPASQFAYGWYEPNAIDPVDSTSATQSGATKADGTLRFVWRPRAADSLSDIAVSESVPGTYTATSVTCVSGATTIFSSTNPATVAAFTLPGLKVRDKVDCTVRNHLKRSTVRVVKNWVGPASTTTIFVDADGSAPYDASSAAPTSGSTASFDYPVSAGVKVGETVVPTGYAATIDCGSGAQPYAGGGFAVNAPATDGATLTCTITNSQLRSGVTVVKNWVGAAGAATIFVDRDGVAPFDAQTVATVNGDNASFGYPVSTPVTVGEVTVPAGYSATIDCGSGPQPYSGGAHAVTSPAGAGATLTCTITNTQLMSTVRVVKQWAGAPSSTTIFVDQDGVAPFDAQTVATADGDNASFDYPVSTPVTVGEVTVPAGYSATIDCGSGPQAYGGGPFAVMAPATASTALTCTITNILVPPSLSTVRVVKNWVGANGSATIFVDQDGVAPFDSQTVATADGDNAAFDYPVSTPVTVGEVGVPAGYSATIDCGSGPQPYSGGPFAVTAPAGAGATLTCTITNTQLVSTVRVVKNWVGAPSTATIFVDQDGVAPFDAQTVAMADGDNASFDYPVSTPVTVGEAAVPAGYSAVIDCGSGPQAYTGGPFAVTAPAGDAAVLTCTITNVQQRSTVQVVKEWAGGAASTTIFVDQDGVAPYDSSTVATASGQDASASYPVSTAVTVGETAVPNGYSATIDCGAGPQAYTGGPFPVTSPAHADGTLTCTITNTPRSTVRVVKNWAGAPSSTTIFVDALGQSPYDASTVASVDGEEVSFDYAPSTQVTLGEVAVPAGYIGLINCGTGPRDLRLYAGGPYTVTAPATAGGVLTCTVSNAKRVSPGRIVIKKKASRRVVRPGGKVKFTITVRNAGPGTVRAVQVCDRLPAGLRPVRAPGAHLIGGRLCWELGQFRPGARRSVVVVAKVGAVKSRVAYVNVAEVKAANSSNCPRLVNASQRQRASCSSRARVVALPRRKSGRLGAHVTFTG